MKRVKIFFGAASVVVAIAAVGATKIASANTLPEYYLNNANQCVLAPAPECVGTDVPCTKLIPGQGATPKQIYDRFVSINSCADPLTMAQ